MQKYLPVIIVIITIGLVYRLLSKNPTNNSTINLNIKNEKFNLEIAKTLTQKSRGLSNRSSLCSNCGMIFVYQKEGTYPFWMKDTLIPLDIIWISNQGVITDIVTANPQPNTPITKLTLYQNTKPAQYIIELNAGRCREIELQAGNQIWTNLPTFP